MVISTEPPAAVDFGKISSIKTHCSCLTSLMLQRLRGIPYYQLTGMEQHCYREDALKKIGDDGRKVEIPETRDAPVPHEPVAA